MLSAIMPIPTCRHFWGIFGYSLNKNLSQEDIRIIREEVQRLLFSSLTWLSGSDGESFLDHNLPAGSITKSVSRAVSAAITQA